MMISTRGRYALRVMLDLALDETGTYVPLDDIARREGMSEKYLESIIVVLSRAGLVKALRGKGGGYRLGRRAEELNCFAVLQAMDETMVPVACLEEGSKPCTRAANCRTLPLWKGLDEVVKNYLGSFTIRDLAKGEDNGFDYVI